jgi:DNA-binding transcriptional ArsR family regulator
MRRIVLEERARILRALGTESRMRIIELLKEGPLEVGTIAVRLGISQSAVSQHMKVLKGMHLVSDERRSYFIHYSLNPREFVRLEEMMRAVCRVSSERSLRRVRRERLLALRDQLKAELERVEQALSMLEE